MSDQPPLDPQRLNPSLRSANDGSHDTSRTAAPMESISIRKPHGGGWAWVALAVFILCVVVSVILIFG
ncbi:hypothetical protein ACIKT0_00550 [Hansschlegelia beijingensis]|uniref:hypothetical protein n=1 Tax=Hansschlegelia beijingensis TaxID=1133344 RepID=UPI00387EEE85